MDFNKKNNKIYIFLLTTVLVLALLKQVVFVVNQTEQVIILQFGKPVKIVKNPGLNFKLPFIQDIVFMENRILDLMVNDKEVIAADQRRVIVNAFAKYIIKDPLKFYNSFGATGMQYFDQLNNMLESSLRQIVGSVELIKLLSNERATIMQRIEDIFNEKVDRYGIKIYDVRIMRADLPKENSSAIYKRMQTERELEAKQIRAEGEESAKKIIAMTNKEKTIMLADAKKQAEVLKGEGEAEVANIFNRAFGGDIEFYSFYKSMQVYKNSLKGDNTKMIITPDNDFLRQLELEKK